MACFGYFESKEKRFLEVFPPFPRGLFHSRSIFSISDNTTSRRDKTVKVNGVC
jgi:hypothetical protein